MITHYCLHWSFADDRSQRTRTEILNSYQLAKKFPWLAEVALLGRSITLECEFMGSTLRILTCAKPDPMPEKRRRALRRVERQIAQMTREQLLAAGDEAAASIGVA